ncbi:hypothetical protein MKW98_031069 [Papaver atlanticum]|uniref:Uncharacterized protein n=1 Tax=Papaver atlanticum TaxID=357466 RepID=A0AAD4XLZ5_9MAGN|nr:hypothetical protein MKW98_031069 [Papaver atlanticum]
MAGKAKKVSKRKHAMVWSSLDKLCEVAEKIRGKINDEDNPKPKHLEAMKNCPFWNLYRPFHEGRIKEKGMQERHKGVEHILNTFDPVKEVFQLVGEKEFKSTAEHLAVIFGLQRIKYGVDLEFTFDPVRQPKEAILESLYATAGDVTKPDDFVKLLILYFCISIFFPNLNEDTMPSKFLKYIFAMDQVSWPDLIHSYLLQALKNAKKPYESVRGCIIYILLTGSFIDPLDDGEQSLMTPIEICQANSDRIGEKMFRDIILHRSKKKKMVRDREGEKDLELSPNRDAARHLEDLAPVHPFKKRKTCRKQSHPRNIKGICNDESGNLPFSNETEVLHTTVKELHGNDVHVGSFLPNSVAHTTGVESLEVGQLVEEPVDGNSTSLLTSTSVDVSPCLKESTSTPGQERVEKSEFVDNLKIPEEYVILYAKICGKYGHIASRKVIKFSDTILLVCVTNLLKVISAMETKRGVELGEALLEEWEGFIKDAEALEFNIKWLREGFNRLKNQWMSSFGIDEKVQSQEQVLVAMKVKCVRLSTRKDELETELSEVKIQIKEAEMTVSSMEEAIQEMQTQKIKFPREPVLGIVLS